MTSQLRELSAEKQDANREVSDLKKKLQVIYCHHYTIKLQTLYSTVQWKVYFSYTKMCYFQHPKNYETVKKFIVNLYFQLLETERMGKTQELENLRLRLTQEEDRYNESRKEVGKLKTKVRLVLFSISQ